MNQAVGLDPLLPWPQLVVFALAAVALSAWVYQRAWTPDDRRPRLVRFALTLLRVTGIAAVMLLLFNPVITQASHAAGKPPLIILFDCSRSMKTRDVDGHSRFDAAKAATIADSDLMDELRRHYDCRLYSFADMATPQDIPAFINSARPDGDQTCIGESLAATLGDVADAQSGGILLVSDGRNNGDIDPVEAAIQAKTRHFPVFAMTVGTATQGRDVSVFNRRPQVFAAPSQEVPLSAEVRSVGYTGQTAQVDLRQNGRTVQTESITLDDHRPVTASFNVRQDKEGSYRYTLSVRPQPGEAILTNNMCSIFLQVLKSHARVLVLEGSPSWDVKFLIQALHTDPSIDVDAIFKLSDEKTFAVAGETSPTPSPSLKGGEAGVAGGAAPVIQVPKTAADFAKYDVVIIGKGYEDFFDSAATDALKSFVADHSGNVIFLRGNPGETPANLQALTPLGWSDEELQDIRMKVTDEGKRNPAFEFPIGSDPDMVIQKLPDLISATKVQGEKALSVVLARASDIKLGDQEMAVLAYQNYGQGKVVSLMGEGLWRWALLPPSLRDYGGCYNDFWTQLIRWLVNQSDFLPGQDVTLKTDKTDYSPGQTASLMVFVRTKNKSAPPSVSILLPNGHSTTVTMARGGAAQADFVGSFKVRQQGEYLAQLTRGPGTPIMAPFSVYPDDEEDLVTAADPEMMRMIAEAGGGDVIPLTDVHNLTFKLKQAQTAMLERPSPETAWDRPPVLATILAIFCLEWILRRRWGLL
jgi:hypothetical protein